VILVNDSHLLSPSLIIYLIRLADKLDINLLTAAQRKIEVNKRKYPVEKVKGSAEKYTVHV